MVGMLSPDGMWQWNGWQWVPARPPDQPRGNSRLAVASLVSSLFFPLWPFSSIAGIVLGLLAIREIDRSAGMRGSGLAVAGIAIGAVIVVIAALIIAALIFIGVGCRNGC